MQVCNRFARRVVTAMVAVALACMAVPAAPQAQSSGGGSYGGGNTMQYTLPGFEGLNEGGGGVTLFEADFNSDLGMDLGCAGVGLFDFVQATFDLQNVIKQLKDSMQTMLAKVILTQLMSVPQIAALFDTLNAFGNARFDLFQQSCNINEIRADAKAIYMERCIKSGEAADNCANMYEGGAENLLKKVTKELGRAVAESENVNELMRGFICSDRENTSGSGCFIMSMLPQFRLCLRSSIGESCPLDTYGARDPALTIGSMFNATTESAAAFMTPVDAFFRCADNMLFNRAQKRQAAAAAVARASRGEKPANYKQQLEMPEGELVQAFLNQLGCQDPYAFTLPGLYEEELNKIAGQNAACGLSTEVDTKRIEDYINQSMAGALRDAYRQDNELLGKLASVGTACLMNRNGLTDPYLWLNVAELSPDQGTSARRAMQRHVGYQLAMELADFTIGQLSTRGYAGLLVDRGARAAGAVTSTSPRRQQELPQSIRQPLMDAVDQMIFELEKQKESLRAQRDNERALQSEVMRQIQYDANHHRLNDGLPMRTYR